MSFAYAKPCTEQPSAANDNARVYLVSTAQADTSLGPDIRVRPHLIVNQMRPHGFEVNGPMYKRQTPEAQYFDYYLGNGTRYYAQIRPKVAGVYDVNYHRYVNHAFDALGREVYELTREGYSTNTSPQAPYTSLYYDDADNLERLRYYSGAYANYTYDKNGLMETARFSQTNDPINEREVASYTYDLLGRRRVSNLGDVNALTPVNSYGAQSPAYARQQFNYDADGNLKRIMPQWSLPLANRTTLTGFHFNYDQDASGKIVAAYNTHSHWRPDPQTVKTETYVGTNDLDQYGTVDLGDGAGAQAQTFDAAGNLTSDGAGRDYFYNSENQMIRAKATGLDMEYWYDAEGRRSHSIDHIANTETFHKHVGQMEVGDYAVTRTGGQIPTLQPDVNGNASPAPAQALTYTSSFHVLLGQSIDERIAYHDVDGDDLRFYMTNHQGSTIAMTNENGTLRAYGDGGRYVYDPYGNDAFKDTADEVSLSGNPYRDTGRRLDAQTGLYYYRARYYSPEQGKFLQTDPIGYQDQMNLYNYVGNDPLNATDPFGLETVTSCGGVSSTCDQGIGGQNFSGGTAAENLDSANMAAAKVNAKLTADTGHEWGTTFEGNKDGSVTASISYSSGSAESVGAAAVEILLGTDNPAGDQHTHPGLPDPSYAYATEGPSVPDIRSANKLASSNGAFTITVVDGPSGNVVSRAGTSGTYQGEKRTKVPDIGVNRIIGNVGPIPYKKK